MDQMKTWILVLSLLLTTLAVAQPEDRDRGWYIGGELGISKLDLPDDDEEAMGGVFGGYRFNRYFGLEAGFNHFATFESGEVLRRGERADLEKSIDGTRFMVVGMLPVSKEVSLFGKAGLFHGFETEIFEYDDDDFRIKSDEDDTGPAVELGILFKVHRSWELSLAAGRYSSSILDFQTEIDGDVIVVESDGDNIDFAKFSVSYKFGRR
jgi:hypothetical protein